MPRRGIVNVRMVITEEKILSNIEKVQRLINPNSKKQIVELDDNSYFKDLVESIKTYLIEYPKKKNFPKSVYDEAYGLVEYATNQFEENTKQIEELIRQREKNIKLAAILKQTLAIIESKDPEWKKSIENIETQFPEDIIEALQVIGRSRSDNSENYQDAIKLINARIANLEANLHIEIDMERVEDRSKALSYIGIEIADALKLIPTPVEEVIKAVEKEIEVKENIEETTIIDDKMMSNNVVEQNYIENTEKPKKVKSSLWNRIKNSKLVRTVKYALKIKVVLELPEAVAESNEKDNN